MKADPTPAPAPAPPATANESGLSLETEPLFFFDPTVAGLEEPGSIQPFPRSVPFDEEPDVRAEVAK